MTTPEIRPDFAASVQDTVGRFRSAAVARMTGIAVATLRVWERRYRVVAPPQSTAGHRLYSSADVRRLSMIRTLTERGHAIGSIASLPESSLQALLLHPGPAPAGPAGSASPARAAVGLHVGLAGRTLPAVAAAQLGLWPGEHACRALSGLAAAEQAAAVHGPFDLLAIEADTLHPDDADRAEALLAQGAARRMALVYGFGSERLVQRLRAAGAGVWRGPLGRSELALVLRAMLAEIAGQAEDEADLAGAASEPLSAQALAEVARMSSRVLCECPRHLAELIQLLGDFERYSARCATDTPADRQIHHALGRQARQARGHFEDALRRIAADEGWTLPPGPGPGHPPA